MPPLQKTVRCGGVSKGKQKIVKKIVKNVTKNITYNTINNYFQPQQGPAPAPPEAVPEKPPDIAPAGTSIVKPKPKKPKKPKEKRSQWISSFGRRQDKLGAIGFGGVDHKGYRNAMKIKEGIRLYVHTLVNVYFNDTDLVEWSAEKAKCPNGNMVTTDHRVSGKEFRSENYSWRLRWATKKKQKKNQDVSEDAKASKRAKQSHGLVQARQWRGRVKGKGNSWTGGTPDAWDDAPKWVGTCQAEAHTGHSRQIISACLGDGKAHRCKATGKDWEYRCIAHPTEPGYEGEKWWDLGTVEALGAGADDLHGVLVSDMGRVNDGTGTPPSHGTKEGVYRTKTIDCVDYRVHELMGWAFCGARPSPAHTIDHLDPTKLDAEGCISNARSNLSATWADRSTQSTTSRNGSMAATSGKRVRVRVKATGVVTEYDDACSAARALGVDRSFVSNVCRNDGLKSTKFEAAYIEEEKHLVRVRTVMGPGCKLSLVTETERWAEIDPADWEEGGKYFCVRGKKHARTDASKHVASARNKRKRGAK
jgi:hypothetical protein